MDNKITALNFTEDLYTAVKDYFIAQVECGVTEITVKFLTGDKFKIIIEKLQKKLRKNKNGLGNRSPRAH